VQVTTALRVPAEPKAVRADGADLHDEAGGRARVQYDAEVGVLWLQHPGSPTGTHVELEF
jgi:hypothetical protein